MIRSVKVISRATLLHWLRQKNMQTGDAVIQINNVGEKPLFSKDGSRHTVHSFNDIDPMVLPATDRTWVTDPNALWSKGYMTPEDAKRMVSLIRYTLTTGLNVDYFVSDLTQGRRAITVAKFIQQKASYQYAMDVFLKDNQNVEKFDRTNPWVTSMLEAEWQHWNATTGQDPSKDHPVVVPKTASVATK